MKEQTHQSWNALRIYTIITAVAMPIGLAVAEKNKLLILWPWALSMATAFSVLYIIIKFPAFSERFTVPLFLSVALTDLIGNSISVHNYVSLKMNFALFAAFKISAIVVALIAPAPIWLGYLLISLSLILPPMQVILFDQMIPQFTNNSEPWMTIIYSMSAFVILHYRLRSQKIMISLVESKHQEKSLREFADVAVALQDLTNTPLQSIEILTALLREGEISQQEAAVQLEKIGIKFHKIIDIFNEEQKKLYIANHESIDSYEILRRSFNNDCKHHV